MAKEKDTLGKYRALSPIKTGSEIFLPGETIELPAAAAAEFLALGVIEPINEKAKG